MSNKPAVKAFKAFFGAAPWPCDYCGEPVQGIGFEIDGLVHHADENRLNNSRENLRPMHRACHVKHHKTGRNHSAEHRQRISEATTGVAKTYTPEVAARLAESRRGRKDSEETTRRRSAAAKAAWARRKKEQL